MNPGDLDVLRETLRIEEEEQQAEIERLRARVAALETALRNLSEYAARFCERQDIQGEQGLWTQIEAADAALAAPEPTP